MMRKIFSFQKKQRFVMLHNTTFIYFKETQIYAGCPKNAYIGYMIFTSEDMIFSSPKNRTF